MKRIALFEVFKQNSEKADLKTILVDYVIQNTDIIRTEAEDYIGKQFLPRVKDKWKKSGRKLDYFKKKESSWLDEEIFRPKTDALPGPGPGRKTKDFSDSSDRSKWRKIER